MQFSNHSLNGQTNNMLHCATPTSMNGGCHLSLRVVEQDWHTVGSTNTYPLSFQLRNHSIGLWNVSAEGFVVKYHDIGTMYLLGHPYLPFWGNTLTQRTVVSDSGLGIQQLGL